MMFVREGEVWSLFNVVVLSLRGNVSDLARVCCSHFPPSTMSFFRSSYDYSTLLTRKMNFATGAKMPLLYNVANDLPNSNRPNQIDQT